MQLTILQRQTSAANKQQSGLPASLNPTVPVWDWSDCWLEIFQVWRQGQVKPCSGEVMYCSINPTPAQECIPALPATGTLKTMINIPPLKPLIQLLSGHQTRNPTLGKDRGKPKYLIWNARQACVLTQLSYWNFCQLNTDGTKSGSYGVFFFSISLLSFSLFLFSLIRILHNLKSDILRVC